MSFAIPQPLQARAAELFGAEGTRWLHALPEQIAELKRAWSLTLMPPFATGGTCSWVAPVRLAGATRAVLKINYPERESRREGEALRLTAGCGAVRLLRASEDGLSLLLERCAPGVDLWSLSAEE